MNGCQCEACHPQVVGEPRMIVCTICGNKRCPHATNHVYRCTGSNELEQTPQIARIAPPAGRPRDTMTRRSMEEIVIEAINLMPGLSNRQIGLKTGLSHSFVGKVRRNLGMPVSPRATVPAGLKRSDGRKMVLRDGAKPRHERIQEIRRLAAIGNNAEQIAEQTGQGVSNVRKIASEAKIEFFVPRRNKAMDVVGVINETVTIVSAAGRGLKLIGDINAVNVEPQDATALLQEMSGGMKQLRQLVSRLKEIAK